MSRNLHFSIEEFDHPVNHHPVDDMEPVEPEQSKLGEALVRIVIWQISGVSIESVAARTLVLSEVLTLNDDSLSWAQIAEHTGLTRAAVQLMAKELEDQFGLRSANSRTNETKERCKLAQHKHNKSRK